jgi:hypothetical protein
LAKTCTPAGVHVKAIQQFQEEQVKEYKAQDQEFLKWCKEQVKAGRQIGYDCSW